MELLLLLGRLVLPDGLPLVAGAPFDWPQFEPTLLGRNGCAGASKPEPLIKPLELPPFANALLPGVAACGLSGRYEPLA